MTTTAAQHTPGPWTVKEPKGHLLDVLGPELLIESQDWTVAQLAFTGGDDLATARLIAAAPDLLAACEACERAFLDDARAPTIDGDEKVYHLLGNTVGNALLAARTALAKARGKSVA